QANSEVTIRSTLIEGALRFEKNMLMIKGNFNFNAAVQGPLLKLTATAQGKSEASIQSRNGHWEYEIKPCLFNSEINHLELIQNQNSGQTQVRVSNISKKLQLEHFLLISEKLFEFSHASLEATDFKAHS